MPTELEMTSLFMELGWPHDDFGISWRRGHHPKLGWLQVKWEGEAS